MEPRTLDQVQRVAEVRAPASGMPRTDRLNRWAEILERAPRRLLDALPGTEYGSARTRESLRSDNSPLSVAARDPVLREEGLLNDSYGEGKRFFDLSDQELHYILCECHFGEQMLASRPAERLRALAWQPSEGGVVGRLRRFLPW